MVCTLQRGHIAHRQLLLRPICSVPANPHDSGWLEHVRIVLSLDSANYTTDSAYNQLLFGLRPLLYHQWFAISTDRPQASCCAGASLSSQYDLLTADVAGEASPATDPANGSPDYAYTQTSSQATAQAGPRTAPCSGPTTRSALALVSDNRHAVFQ
jgi:hypothetical protein